jgi:hypothetical protein
MSSLEHFVTDINLEKKDAIPKQTKDYITSVKGNVDYTSHILSLPGNSYIVEKKKKPSFFGADKGYKSTNAIVFEYGIFFIGDGAIWKVIWFEKIITLEGEDNGNIINIETTDNRYIFRNPSQTKLWNKFSCDIYTSIIHCPAGRFNFEIDIPCKVSGGRRTTKRSKKSKRRTRRS